MRDYQNELNLVKQALKEDPQGLTITDISKKLHLNRNSVAKYLDVLQISGQVTYRKLGPAKLYMISERVPIYSILNIAKYNVIILDNELIIKQISENILILLELDNGSVIGKRMDETPIPVFQNEELRRKVEKGLMGEYSSTECRFPFKTGEHVCNMQVIPLVFDEGVNGVVVHLEDITERVVAEEKLKESEKLYSTVVEKTSDGIAIVQDGLVLFANRAIQDRLNYSVEELEGQPFTRFLIPKEVERVTGYNIHRLGGHDAPTIYETVFLDKKGEEHPVEVNANTITFRDRQAVLAVIRFLGERNWYIDALKALHRNSILLGEARSLKQVADITIETIRGIFRREDAEFISVEGEWLRLVKTVGRTGVLRGEVHISDRGLITRAVKEKSTEIVRDVRQSSDYFEARYGTLSEIVVPVVSRGEVLALINIESPDVDAFDTVDRELLQIFAQHVANTLRRISLMKGEDEGNK